VDRQAIARAQRARQAREQLAEEREREAALQEALEERVGEVDGPALDELVFAQMDAAEADLVRDRLAGRAEDGPPPEESFWGDDDAADAADGDELEEEISRLARELETCRKRQQAYERYLRLLGA
jgi:hypothetical protein